MKRSRLLHILGVKNGERTLEDIEEMVERIRKRRRFLARLRRKLQLRAKVAQRVVDKEEETDG